MLRTTLVCCHNFKAALGSISTLFAVSAPTPYQALLHGNQSAGHDPAQPIRTVYRCQFSYTNGVHACRAQLDELEAQSSQALAKADTTSKQTLEHVKQSLSTLKQKQVGMCNELGSYRKFGPL